MPAGTQLNARVRGPLVVIAILGLALGCDDEEDPSVDSGVALDSSAPRGDGAVATLTEAEVAGAVNAINAGELALARSVEDRLSDDDIAALAAEVIASHTASAAAHDDVIAELGITPAGSELSAEITELATGLTEDLASLSGGALDAAYLDAQIILDAELLDDTQVSLVPSTSSPQYRTYIFELRDTLVANLAAGRTLDEPAAGGVSP